MRNLFSLVLAKLLIYKYRKFKDSSKNAFDQQQKLFSALKRRLKGTQIYADLNLVSLGDYSQFCAEMPVRPYGFYFPYIQKILRGEKDVLFRDEVVFFAVTTGTINSIVGGEGKRIPYNEAMLANFMSYNTKLAGLIVSQDPIFLNRKGLTFGNCNAVNSMNTIHIPEGYVSGFLAKIAKKSKNRFPQQNTLEINDWGEKIDKIVEECRNKDIQVLSGIPLCILHILEKLLLRTGASTVSQVWPNIEAYIYGGTSVETFRSRIDSLCGKKLKYYGAYLATEAGLGINVGTLSEEYVLNTEDILFSFTSIDDLKTYDISKIEIGKTYKLNISTPNGLVQYPIGDLVKLIDNQDSCRFKVLGRDNMVMSLAGEKMTEDQMNQAINESALEISNAIDHYFVYPTENAKGNPCYGFCLFIDLNSVFMDEYSLSSVIDAKLIVQSKGYGNYRNDERVIDAPLISKHSNRILEAYFLKYSNKGQIKFKKFFNSKDEMNEFMSQFT
jgi:hypothetical protein